MKRIDTITARANMFGVGKAGFHDNADLPGQDATYLSPDWLNIVQEELCNLLELRGLSLNPDSKRQLYDLLATQADLEVLANEIENNFIRKNQIIDNLTTDDANKPISAKQAKLLQDNKLNKSDLENSLTSTATDKAATAAQVKILNDRDFGVGQTWKNLTASRVLGTTYTNTTGKPIVVCVRGYLSAGGGQTGKINGETVQSFSGYSSGLTSTVTLIVPPGGTYSVSGSKEAWWELN